jgi:hypothetical protein
MEKNAILPKSLPSYPFCKFLQGNPSKLKWTKKWKDYVQAVFLK